MSTRDEEIEARAVSNMQALIEHGPGLRFSTRDWIVARGDGRVLIGGLGGLGVGRCWHDDADMYRADPTYTEAPYSPETTDDFGNYGYEQERSDVLRRIDETARAIAKEAADSVYATARKALRDGATSFTLATESVYPADRSSSGE